MPRPRKPAARPGQFRPAAEIVKDLIRSATPRKDRAPKRPPKEDESLLRYVDLDGATVTAMRTTCETVTITLSIALRDHPRVDLASREAVALADRSYVGKVSPPLGMRDGSPVLTVIVPKPPDALVPGSTLNLRIGLRVDLEADPVTVQAVATRLEAIRPPQVSAPPITLPSISFRSITDSDLGMPESDAAQARAESYLHAAIAFKARKRAA